MRMLCVVEGVVKNFDKSAIRRDEKRSYENM